MTTITLTPAELYNIIVNKIGWEPEDYEGFLEAYRETVSQKELLNPTAADMESWLETIWNALHGFREDCIPEGQDEAYDSQWSDICTAMHWLREALYLPDEVLKAQASEQDVLS